MRYLAHQTRAVGGGGGWKILQGTVAPTYVNEHGSALRGPQAPAPYIMMVKSICVSEMACTGQARLCSNLKEEHSLSTVHSTSVLALHALVL